MNSLKLSKELIKFKSISPSSNGSIEFIADILGKQGFECNILEFGEKKVKNLYAFKHFGEGPNVCFAGHTDVVPPGDIRDWKYDPFSPTEKDGKLFGRGACDMKGAIGAFISASMKFIEKSNSKFNGSISFLLTADEEGDADYGTKKVVDWLKKNNKQIDFCVVGEPTNPSKLGEMVKIGRRGSLNGWITVNGKQGHVAYPHNAINPIDGILKICNELALPLDSGSKAFQPSNLVVTSLDVGNDVTNLIPNKGYIKFNVRFNDNFNSKDLISLLNKRLEKLKIEYSLKVKVSGESFFNFSEKLTQSLVKAINKVCNTNPDLSTTGGTSDARFISKICPVIEFGLIGKTMHQINENSKIQDIENLDKIYLSFLENIFKDRF